MSRQRMEYRVNVYRGVTLACSGSSRAIRERRNRIACLLDMGLLVVCRHEVSYISAGAGLRRGKFCHTYGCCRSYARIVSGDVSIDLPHDLWPLNLFLGSKGLASLVF